MDCSHRTVEYQEWVGNSPRRSFHFRCVICDYEFGMNDYGNGRMSHYVITGSKAEVARERAIAQASEGLLRELEISTLARRVWPPHSSEEAELLKQHGAATNLAEDAEG